MERLTYRSEYGNAVSYGACSDVSCKLRCNECKIDNLIKHLAAYEDTGYEPGQFEEAMDAIKAHLWDVEQELRAYKDTGLTPEEIELYKEAQEICESMAPERLVEISGAEKAGRLVVLPEEKELTDEEIAEITGYKCPICKHHNFCTMPGMRAMCGESYTHFEPRNPQEAEEAMREEG